MDQLQGELDPELLRDETLIEIFRASAEKWQDRPAIVTATAPITYGELSSLVDQICKLLAANGIGRGARVGILMPRSIESCATLLAVMAVGAAYVPIDPAYPEQRCQFIVNDCGAAAVLTTNALIGQARKLVPLVIAVDLNNLQAVKADHALPVSAALPDDIAYIIYTSGTTGKAKGVPIAHRSVCHFVRAEAKLFCVKPEDRVYHGFSLSFDASVEELWLAWFAGACLLVAPEEIARSGDELPVWLSRKNVSVLSCVPTLLALFEQDIPTVRLLILGGEVCPPHLVECWTKPGRRIANTYGPTEATVVATYAWCQPDRTVTIGHLLPNVVACILNDSLEPVAPGQSGELCLGGPGLSGGYLNRQELTRVKFIANPAKAGAGCYSTLFRTGDLVRLNEGGELEFLGRTDDQVKLRGYRIELGDVEAALRAIPGVLNAAAAVREVAGSAELVGYLVPGPPGATQCDTAAWRSMLRAQLPAFMIPSYLEIVDSISTFVSGKIDRSRLPQPSSLRAPEAEPAEEGLTEMERLLFTSWSVLFPGQSVRRSDNFFDLGGHSLLAVRMVSELRRRTGLSETSVVDVYRHPVMADLASVLQLRIDSRTTYAPKAASTTVPVGQLGRWLCWLGQALGLYLVFAIFSLQSFLPWFAFDYLEGEAHRATLAVLLALAVAVAFQPVQMFLCVVLKLILIGRYKEGDYPVWGFFYWRFWLVRTVYRLFAFSTLHGTPFMPLLCRWMGARVGSNVYIACDIQGSELIEIGAGTSLNPDAQLRFFSVEGGLLKLRRIRIGSNCEIGQRAVVEGGAAMEDNSTLGPLSLLPRGCVLPRNDTWEGSPARHVSSSLEPEPFPLTSFKRKMVSSGFYCLGFLSLALLPLCSLVPGALLLDWVSAHYPWYWSVIGAVPVLIASFMILLALQIAAAKWILLGRVKPGRYPLHGWFYIRHWFCDQLLRLGLELLFPAYSTLFLPPWLRLLGARVGRRAEVSTMMHFTPDLIDIADDVFVADVASVGAARVRSGWLELAPVKFGTSSFIGNSAVIPGGTILGEKCLVGCLSVSPRSGAQQALYDASWMGSPAIFLPNRPINRQFSDEFTYRPSRQLYFLRGAIELVRMILPGTVLVATSLGLMNMFSALGNYLEWPELIVLFPFFSVLLGLVAATFTIATKWLVIGRYREGEDPLWSTFVWRSELVTAMHDYLAAPMMLNLLRGTPFLSWYLRAMGTRVGANVYLDSTWITEFDLVEIGANCCIDTDCDLQTHLFEDRVMKMSHVRLGDGCSVGAFGLILYDTRLADDVVVAPLSLVLKGETLPARDGRWVGSPALAMSADYLEPDSFPYQPVSQPAAVP